MADTKQAPWIEAGDDEQADKLWGPPCTACGILRSTSGAPCCECDNANETSKQ